MSDTTTDTRIDTWLRCLSESGYRVTAPRKAVLQVVASAERALNPAEVYERGRVEYERLGLVTVYRTLEKLEELDIIQRIHHPDGCHAFVAGGSGHQHPLICRQCGRTEFFRGDDLAGLIADVEARTGYRVEDHWLQFFGRCPDCAAAPD